MKREGGGEENGNARKKLSQNATDLALGTSLVIQFEKALFRNNITIANTYLELLQISLRAIPHAIHF